MASYLHWDDEDMFHHLCASLEAAVGQVLLDTDPHATTADIVCLLQTKFGTQLQVEHFKAELHDRWGAPGESLQQRYQASAEALLVAHVGKEAFIAALSVLSVQLQVRRRRVRLPHSTS